MVSAGLIATITLDQDFSRKFYKDVLREIGTFLMRSMPRAVGSIKNKLSQAVRVRIMSAPEYGAIAGGTTSGELGISDGASRLNAIIDRWAESVSVRFIKGSGKSLGLIDIGILQEDWEDVLSMAEAELTYSSKRGTKTLPWLRWLLKEGSATIVSQYDFIPSPRGSRTGFGIMVKRRGGWKVPAQLAGTEKDNFATRALDDIATDINTIVRREITRVI